MSRLSIPIDVITSRLNINDRLNSVRSQSLAQRFSNLKPISEFLDLRRLSKPRDFGDVQARVNYNLSYFSSNYAVVFVMLSIYALLTNAWLLFDIVFISVSMWVIGRLQGRDLEIGTFRATTSQLYTGVACIGIPIAFFAGPIGTFLWLTYRECFFRGGGLGGRPRAPYDVPQWGRPPGARLGRDRGAYGGHQSWIEDEQRFEEVDTTDEDYVREHLRDDPRRPFLDRNFHSDDLLFDGIDYDARTWRRGRSNGEYYNDMEFEQDDNYYQRDQDYPLQRKDSNHSVIHERDEELAARALERISRARALGKASIKLSQAEIDVLDRVERARQRDQPTQHTQQPEVKVSAAPKAANVSKKTVKPKAIEAAKHKRADSPKGKIVHGRVRNHSNVSTRSTRSTKSTREDDLVTYQIPQDSDYSHDERTYQNLRSGYQGSPLRPRSRTNSSHNIRQMPGPIFAPYYANPGRYVSMPEGPYHRRMESGPASNRYSRLDPLDATDVGHHSRSQSSSNMNLRSFPLDQLPHTTHTGRVPRFDPDDPHYAAPSRRVVSGPTAQLHRRPSDELYLPDEAEVLSYMVPPSRSSSGSDASYRERPTRQSSARDHDSEREELTRDVHEPNTKKGQTVKTRSAAAATTTSTKTVSKGGVKVTRRR